jgi:RNA-binding protein YhbY
MELERDIREHELMLQSRRGKLQKMAEVLSANVNRVLVDTIGQTRLLFVPAKLPKMASSGIYATL